MGRNSMGISFSGIIFLGIKSHGKKFLGDKFHGYLLLGYHLLGYQKSWEEILREQIPRVSSSLGIIFLGIFFLIPSIPCELLSTIFKCNVESIFLFVKWKLFFTTIKISFHKLFYLIALSIKFVVTNPTARKLQTTTITMNPLCLKKDSNGFCKPKLRSCSYWFNFFLAKKTKLHGIMYWMPAPA